MDTRPFDLAEELELSVALLYGLLATRYADDANAKQLFLDLEREEYEHVNRVRLGRSMAQKDPDSYSGLQVDTQQLLTALAQAKEARRLVESPVDLPLEEAVRIAGDLEGGFAEAHTRLLATGVDLRIVELFEKLAQFDRAHHDLLEAWSSANRELTPVL